MNWIRPIIACLTLALTTSLLSAAQPPQVNT